MAKKKNVYLWEGVDRSGTIKKGEIEGSNIGLIKAGLRNKGIKVKKIKKHSTSKSIFGPKKIQIEEICAFTRQLSTLTNAGVPILKSLEIIMESSEGESFKIVVSDIYQKVNAGMPLSQALALHPKQFDVLFTGLVEAGEESGSLEQMLDRLAIHMEKGEMIRSKIKKAMTYPLSVVVIASAITILLLVKVVPVFEQMFESFGAELPMPTQVVVAMSEFMQAYWYIVVGTVVGAVVIFKKIFERSQAFRDSMDVLKLKLPVFSDMLKNASVARFSRVLATTFSSGVTLIDGLESVRKAIGNKVYMDAIEEIGKDVRAGLPLNVAIRETGIFPPDLYHMVAIGEESGALDKMLNNTADIYEAKVNNSVDNLTALMEPMIMATLGIIIGGLIIALYLPIFQMGSVV